MATIHDEIENWLAAAVHDQLSSDERKEFQTHLAACAECRALNEETTNMSRLIENTLAEENPDLGFEQRMLSGFRSKAPSRNGGVLPFFVNLLRLRSAQITAVAALLITLVQVGRMVTNEGSTPLGMVAGEFGMRKSMAKARGYAAPEGPVSSYSADTNARESSESRAVEFKKSDMAAVLGGVAQNRADLAPPPPLKDAQVMAAEPEFKEEAPASRTARSAARPASERAETDPAQSTAVTPADSRKLIRNAQVELTVMSYEAAVQNIATFAAEERGFVATSNSTKLANGKLQGTVVAKVVPENLDRFLQKLRGLGELKNQTLGTDDVTKAYFDTDARLRNAKRMEERLLEMLQKATGKVSDLLQVEKELGRVRQEIERMQGELKYYDALVSYATVTISLSEKDMNEPAAFLLKRRANLALFSADVEKTFNEAKSVVDGTKSQLVNSTLDRDASGEVTGRLTLLIVPEEADAVIGRIKGMGRVQNFTEQTERVAQGGSGMSNTAKVERDKVELSIVVSRHEQEPPVQQTSLRILTSSVADNVGKLKAAAAKASAEVRSSTFSRDPNGREVANVTLRVPMKNYAGLIASFDQLGKVKDLSVHREDRPGVNTEETAPADISIHVYSEGNIVSDRTGIIATIRRTLGQGAAALMWSLRMIGVAVAFLAPWALAITLVVWIVARVSRARRARKEVADKR